MSSKKRLAFVLLMIAIFISVSSSVMLFLLKGSIIDFKLTKQAILFEFSIGFVISLFALSLIKECQDVCDKYSIPLRGNEIFKIAAQYSPKVISFSCLGLAALSFLLGPMSRVSYSSDQTFTYFHAVGFSSINAVIGFVTTPLFLSVYKMRGNYLVNLLREKNENT